MWHTCGWPKKPIIEKIGKGLYFLISPGQREILLVDLTSFINIGMQVNFRGLDRGMAEVFLYNPQVL